MFGRDTYDTLKSNAKIIVAIGTCTLVIVFTLTYFIQWKFVGTILNLVTGTSLLFVVYIAALIILLDFEIEIDDYYKMNDLTYAHKSNKYRLTIIWGIILIALGIAAIYFSQKYKKHYAFQCTTYWVDIQNNIYHLDWDNDCEDAESSQNDLIEMKGVEIERETTYTLCEYCKEWSEDAECKYESNSYDGHWNRIKKNT